MIFSAKETLSLLGKMKTKRT